MKILALALVVLLANGCFVSKREAGLCARPRCDNKIHQRDQFCGGCGNCTMHCISSFFQGPNR